MGGIEVPKGLALGPEGFRGINPNGGWNGPGKSFCVIRHSSTTKANGTEATLFSPILGGTTGLFGRWTAVSCRNWEAVETNAPRKGLAPQVQEVQYLSGWLVDKPDELHPQPMAFSAIVADFDPGTLSAFYIMLLTMALVLLCLLLAGASFFARQRRTAVRFLSVAGICFVVGVSVAIRGIWLSRVGAVHWP
jgi:hypothetical protein